jgi:alanine-synthesizing transaminase
VNYPGNPTAEVVDLNFYQRLVDLCKHYGVYAISDLAYCEIYFDGNPPPSILQAKGAKNIAIEFTTLSKTYSMAGWRVGFAAGNTHLITALTKIKSYLDYGTFTPIQVAATAALNGPQECVEEMRARYQERRDVVVKGLNAAGWPVPNPAASMFIWAPLPEQYKSLGSFAFARMLLDQAEVAVAPGIGFGEYGDGHVRIALVENKQRLRQAVRNIKAFLAKDPAKMMQQYAEAA